MNTNKQRLVLFVGTGFSAGAGMPTMSDFLKQATEQLPSDIMRRINAGFYFTEYSMQDTKYNLETVYGAMVFRKLLTDGNSRVATLSHNGKFIPRHDGPTIQEVIEGFEYGIAVLCGKDILADKQKQYSDFFTYLSNNCDLGVVTTNYDLAIEKSINGKCSYSYSSGNNSDGKHTIPILKLHGSVNWPTDNLDIDTIDTTAKPLQRAFILPPTWNKNLESYNPFIKIWQDATKLIGEANIILIIGHSFPATDFHLQYLFAEALARKSNQPENKRVIVVNRNPETAEAVEAHFRKYQTIETAKHYVQEFEKFCAELKSGSNPLSI